MSSLNKLQLTSTLFGTIVLHSYYKRDNFLHFLSLNITILSILNHSTQNIIVRKIDKIFAHILGIYATIKLLFLMDIFFFLSLLIIVMWKLEENIKDNEKAINLHVLIHILTVIGINSYLFIS